mgnify:CR=1 FL=1
MKTEQRIITEIRTIKNQLKRIEINSDEDGLDRSEDVKSKLMIIDTLRWVLD